VPNKNFAADGRALTFWVGLVLCQSQFGISRLGALKSAAAENYTIKEKIMKKRTSSRQVKETQDLEIEQNVHVRILQYLNGAKKPQDLMVLPKNEQEVLIDPEHRRKRPFRHELQPAPQKDPEELFSHKIAEQILAFRQAKFPLGFTHIFDIRDLLRDRRRIELVL